MMSRVQDAAPEDPNPFALDIEKWSALDPPVVSPAG
jgi:hypothetical protein